MTEAERIVWGQVYAAVLGAHQFVQNRIQTARETADKAIREMRELDRADWPSASTETGAPGEATR